MTKIMRTRGIAFLLAFIMVFCTVYFTVQTPVIAYAQESETYSSVLDDLKKDKSFDAGHYPASATDYSLKIIQLAESVDKELFVYVYQPSGKDKNLRASSINISTTINDSISFTNYKLEYLNSSGVFYKYKVKDLAVKSDAVRHYAISSIFRPFDESIDEQATGGNTITEVNYDISKQYTFGEINGKLYVNCVDIETIVVTDKFVGFVRYPDGFQLYVGACDSHFVAFNTNKPMDKLLEPTCITQRRNIFHRGRHLSEKTKRSARKPTNMLISNTPIKSNIPAAVGLRERINGIESRRLMTL